MIIVLIIAFALLMVGFIITAKMADNNGSYGLAIISTIAAICSGIALFITVICSIDIINDVMSEKYIDDKIIMYEEENLKIEAQIGVLVEQYMSYEKETLTEFKGNEMALVSLYPELKSDTLVQQQITVHTENNAKIKELKEKKIDLKLSKWWLYFGQ